jgi:hypothetical protein
MKFVVDDTKIDKDDSLHLVEAPTVELGTNLFVGVPVVLKYDETNLIEIVSILQAGYTTRFSLFNSDGEKIGKVVGSRLIKTDIGQKCGLEEEHRDKVTALKLGTQTLAEIRRTEAAALKTEAELYVPDGKTIKIHSETAELLSPFNGSLRLGGTILTRNTIENCSVGIKLSSDGGVGIGCSG